jgi:GNAT superfamily N-acetyltransferase
MPDDAPVTSAVVVGRASSPWGAATGSPAGGDVNVHTPSVGIRATVTAPFEQSQDGRMRFTVDPSPAGGFHVRMAGSPAPLSHHDTLEDAEARIARYQRGAAQPGGELVDLPDGSEVLVRPDSEAIVALDPRGGAALGVANYRRDPERPATAEATVAVIDDWQGRGLGSVLLRRLCRRAKADGIDTFTASLVTDNRSMMRLFERLGRVQVRELDGPAMQIDVELAVDDVRTLLRSAATGHVRP